MTNMDEQWEDEDCVFARARQNPAALQVRFAGGVSFDELECLDIRETG